MPTRATLAIAGLLAALMSAPASAQNFPDPGFNERDAVTGYLCLDPGCTSLRMTEANCICEKLNPNEQRLEALRLRCSTREGGKWVACPFPPRYGTMVDE